MAEYDLDSKNIPYENPPYDRNNELSNANLPVNGAGVEEDEGIDWFNMGRWGESLKESLGNFPENYKKYGIPPMGNRTVPLDPEAQGDDGGMDWFNMGRWKEALKQTLGNPQNEFIKPKEGTPGYDVNQEALLDLVMSASPMGAIGSLKNVGGLAKAGLRKAVKGGRTKAQKGWASANKETWMNPSQKDEFLREPYDQLDELYNRGGDYVESGKDMISDYLKSIFGGK